MASVALVLYAVARRMRLPDTRDLPAVILSGFLALTVYHVALNYGEVTVSAGSASILVNTAPIFTVLLAAMFLGEHIGLLGWAGMGVSFLGAALISFGEGEDFFLDPSAPLVLLSAVSSAMYFVVSKPYLRKYTALEFTTYAIWAGTVLTVVFLPGLSTEVVAAPLGTTLTMIYLGLFPTAVAYIAPTPTSTRNCPPRARRAFSTSSRPSLSSSPGPGSAKCPQPSPSSGAHLPSRACSS